MSDEFTVDDRLLTIQFLGVLHTWLQETKAEKERELELLQLQEGIVKIMFARISRPEDFHTEEVIEAGEKVFSENWEEMLEQEIKKLNESEPLPETERDNIIDFSAWKKKDED